MTKAKWHCIKMWERKMRDGSCVAQIQKFPGSSCRYLVLRYKLGLKVQKVRDSKDFPTLKAAMDWVDSDEDLKYHEVLHRL